MTPRDMTANPWIAAETRGAAELLSVQGANLFRVAAYRRAASFISQLEGDLLEMGAAGGRGALDKIPGIGPAIAKRIHQDLLIDRPEALEIAAHDGRLAALPGFGQRREAMVRSALANLLSRRLPSRTLGDLEPEVALLLDVDQEYRSRGAKGELHRITPRRFNPLAQRLVAGPAHLPRTVVLHRALFEHGSGPQVASHHRLGGGLFPSRRQPGRTPHRRD